MLGRRVSTASLLLATLFLSAEARSDEQARQADPVVVETFTRAGLFRQFDFNGDTFIEFIRFYSLRFCAETAGPIHRIYFGDLNSVLQ
jgi:hypothetical protein